MNDNDNMMLVKQYDLTSEHTTRHTALTVRETTDAEIRRWRKTNLARLRHPSRQPYNRGVRSLLVLLSRVMIHNRLLLRCFFLVCSTKPTVMAKKPSKTRRRLLNDHSLQALYLLQRPASQAICWEIAQLANLSIVRDCCHCCRSATVSNP